MTQPPYPPYPDQPGQPGQPGLPPDPRRIRGGRIGIGIGIALGAHVLSIGIAVIVAAVGHWSSDVVNTALGIVLITQFVVFVACIAVGIQQIARGDRGVGTGILIGWAIGVVVLPVVGFGVCVAALSGSGL